MKPYAGLVAATFAVLLAGCGGGSSTVATSTPSAATTSVQVNLGDAPADRLLAANMHIQSLSFTTGSGGTVPLLTTGADMEVMQSIGTVRPLLLANMPQGTYAGATMTFTGATVTYMDPATRQVIQRTLSGPMTAAVDFSPALAVGSAPMVVNLDLDMGHSLSIDDSGNVVMTPTMTATWRAAIPGSPDPEDGGIGRMTGVVSSVSGASLHLAMLQGAADLPLMTNAATEFVGLSGMAGMGAGMLAEIDGTRQPDGTWMASRVHALIPAGGTMAMGVVTDITGNPPTQLVLAMQDGAGLSMMRANLAGTTTVALTGDTMFGFDADDVDLSNLPFTPRFDAAAMRSGQRVAAFSSGAMMQGGGMRGMTGGGSLAARSVQLVPQGLRGTVSGYAVSGTRSTFTLMVAADSAFATLSGSRSVIVYQQPGTRMGPQSIANGDNVIVRGLLFVDNGAFSLVATRIAST